MSAVPMPLRTSSLHPRSSTDSGTEGTCGHGAQPKLKRKVCVDGGKDGITYAGSAGGVARQNKCSENQLHGIEVQDEAKPTLEANGCSRNAQAGIGFSDSAGGVARENDCSGNKWGIYVAETADPELEDNDCRENREEDVLDLREG